jgi:hypothetical protein
MLQAVGLIICMALAYTVFALVADCLPTEARANPDTVHHIKASSFAPDPLPFLAADRIEAETSRTAGDVYAAQPVPR